MMTRIGYCDVTLRDDGTLDTVLDVDSPYGSSTERFSDTSEYRLSDGSLTGAGFRELAAMAVEAHVADLMEAREEVRRCNAR